MLSPESIFRMELGQGEQLPDGRRMLSEQELAFAPGGLGGMLAVQIAARVTLGAVVLMEPAISPISALSPFFARKYREGAIDDGRTHFVNEAPGFRRLANPDSFDPALMDAQLSALCQAAGVATTPMPDGVRLRQAGGRRFVFNYNPEDAKSHREKFR